MTTIMDLSFPGQRTATATLCIPLDSVYMPGPRIGKSEYGFFGCDTWLRIFQNDSQKSHWLHSSIKFANPVTCTKILSTFFQDQTLWSLNWGVPKEKFHCILHVHVGLLILNLSNAWLTRLDCSQSPIFSWDRRGPLDFQMYRGGRASVIIAVGVWGREKWRDYNNITAARVHGACCTSNADVWLVIRQ